MDMELNEVAIAKQRDILDEKLLDCRRQIRFVLISLGSLLFMFSLGYVCFGQVADQFIPLHTGIFFVAVLGHAAALYHIISREFDLERLSNQNMLDYPVIQLFQKMKQGIVQENENYQSLFDIRMVLMKGSILELENKLSKLENGMKK